jgi:hypothetical protein
VFPKRKARSIPSIRAGAGDAHSAPGRKSSVTHSILIRFGPFLAGSPAVGVLQGVVYFLNFIFVAALFERGNQFIAIESDLMYGAVGPPGERPSRGMAGGGISHDRCRIPDFRRQNDQDSDTKHKTLITRLFVCYMTTNTIHMVNTHILKWFPKVVDHGKQY